MEFYSILLNECFFMVQVLSGLTYIILLYAVWYITNQFDPLCSSRQLLGHVAKYFIYSVLSLDIYSAGTESLWQRRNPLRRATIGRPGLSLMVTLKTVAASLPRMLQSDKWHHASVPTLPFRYSRLLLIAEESDDSLMSLIYLLVSVSSALPALICNQIYIIRLVTLLDWFHY